MDIGWSVTSDTLDLFYDIPENLVSKVRKEYLKFNKVQGDISKCLGVQDLWGSVYELKFPFDIRFKYNKESRQVIVDDKFTNIDLTKLNELISCTESNFTNKNPVIRLLLRMFFVSDKPCTLTIIPPIFELEKNPMWSKIRLVSARMNIHSWQRDVNFGFELLDKDAEITIRKGEVISYIMFNSENLDEKFNIKKVEFKGKLKEHYDLVNNSRSMISSGTRYLLGKALGRRPKKLVHEKGKCPYGFDKLKFW